MRSIQKCIKTNQFPIGGLAGLFPKKCRQSVRLLLMTLQQHGCVMFNSPHRAVILHLTPEYQCLWFQFYRASNFYCMAIATEPSLPSGPPSAADWAAVNIAAALETTRHASGAVRQAGGDKLRRHHTATRGSGSGGNHDDKDWTDADRDNADSNDNNSDKGGLEAPVISPVRILQRDQGIHTKPCPLVLQQWRGG